MTSWGSRSSDGELPATGTFNEPWGVAVDAQSRVYVTDPEGYRVLVFSSSGIPLAVFGQYGPEEDSFGLPVGIVTTANGEIWIADTGNNRLSLFNPWQ